MFNLCFEAIDQSQRWSFTSLVTLTIFQLRFMTTVRKVNQGYVFVDDIGFGIDDCPKTGFCDFSSSHCGWSNPASNPFNWLVGYGRVDNPSSIQGPPVDHTHHSKNSKSSYPAPCRFIRLKSNVNSVHFLSRHVRIRRPHVHIPAEGWAIVPFIGHLVDFVSVLPQILLRHVWFR